MQAILVADYSFTPLEYWRGVSLPARDFIRRCLTTDPRARMTAHEALSHRFVSEDLPRAGADGSGDASMTGADLLPVVKKNFNARRTLHAAIDTIRAINKLREGGGAMMATAMSVKEARGEKMADTRDGGGDRMDIDSRGNARGQTEEQIREQERRVVETSRGLWGAAVGR